jgi:hypothetical protein
MPNKTRRKELSSETIAVILALDKIGYTASQIGKKALLKIFQSRQLPFRSDRPKNTKMTLLSKPFKLGDLRS